MVTSPVMYRFRAGSDRHEKPVKVDGEFLRKKELARLVAIDRVQLKLTFKLPEQGNVRIVTGPRVVSAWVKPVGAAEKVKVTLKPFPWSYARVVPMFLMQGSQYKVLGLKCHSSRMGKNLLYMAVTRAMGSPYEGWLRIEGIATVAQLGARLKACPKSIVFNSKIGEQVPEAFVRTAMDELAGDERFWTAMAHIDTLRII